MILLHIFHQRETFESCFYPLMLCNKRVFHVVFQSTTIERIVVVFLYRDGISLLIWNEGHTERLWPKVMTFKFKSRGSEREGL